MTLVLLLLLGCAPEPATDATATPAAATRPPTPIAAPSPPAPTADAPPVAPPPAAKPNPPAGPTICGLSPRDSGPYDAALEAFGRAAGLDHPDAFASVATTLHRTGRLPDCYLTKRDAEAGGWSPGEPVWTDLPGRAIGGDRFGNRERRLPDSTVGYVEADLDDDGGRRGAHRLVFSKDTKGAWRMWVTVDHYEHFSSVADAMEKAP
jgi:hypothetical protein